MLTQPPLSRPPCPQYASKVYLLVRSAKMRATAAMQDRVMCHPTIEVVYNAQPVAAVGDADGWLSGLRLEDTAGGQERTLPVVGCFYGIGHTPNSGFLQGQLALDDKGYVVVSNGAEASVEGVFAAGDLHDTVWRQAVTAAGSGCMAAIAAERYLSHSGLTVEVRQEVCNYPGTEPPPPAASSAGGVSSVVSSSNGAAAAAAGGGGEEESFDPSATLHSGQYALRKLYHSSERPLLVIYTAPGCGPCRRLKPMLEGVVAEYADSVHYCVIDIETDSEIAEAAGVTGTPCVHVFKHKERIAEFNGVKMKSEYRAVLDAALGRTPVGANN